MTKKLLAASTLAFLLSTGAAFAQTTTSATDTTGEVGVPNTGAGGNAAQNFAILAASGLVALAAGAGLMRQRVR